MSAVALDRPWLTFDLGREMPVLSWAVNRPGLVEARRILWREVRNADLPADLDVDGWLNAELHERGATDAVTFLTSRDIRFFTERRVRAGDVAAHAVATVGFSNAERIGHRVDRTGKDWGTINVALHLDAPMTEAALLESMSIVVQARTAAVMDARLRLPVGIATGTGTDCVAVAAPRGGQRYAGLHTEIGEAAGRAVYDAVLEGARDWMASNREVEAATS
ncbi:adenosylcobinamide amidohydrolase [Roseovarius sp. A21]|uniref:Adenosylcobinamide amidohydrolase n=1 Tax=Roseovarius bejariae TaxID=2576383 RepID=A0A844D327_9RHOB|nr:adenosylcobinamide amidohydrolase [Roseovarius bejariae]MRU16624.1 adenosylcobinamide amidohydrolase [Roseovarius bejariae]